MNRLTIAAAAVAIVSFFCPSARPGVLASLALLPHHAVGLVWAALVVAALVATVEAMHRVTDLPRVALFFVFGPIDAVCATAGGNLAPFATASLALAMLALSTGRPRSAAVMLACSLCVPQIGFAALLAFFVCLPRTRTAIACGTFAAALAWFGALGGPAAFARARSGLPAQALTALASRHQLSVPGLLHAIGVPEQAALALGVLAYLIALAFGITTARRLCARSPLDPLILAAPAAFAVAGAVFVGAPALAAAFPAALVAFARVGGRLRMAIGAALIASAVPWVPDMTLALGVPCIALLSGLLAKTLLGVSARVAIGVGTLVACCTCGLAFAAVFGVARLPEWLAIASLAVAVAMTAQRRYFESIDRRTIRFGVRATSHDW